VHGKEEVSPNGSMNDEYVSRHLPQAPSQTSEYVVEEAHASNIESGRSMLHTAGDSTEQKAAALQKELSSLFRYTPPVASGQVSRFAAFDALIGSACQPNNGWMRLAIDHYPMANPSALAKLRARLQDNPCLHVDSSAARSQKGSAGQPPRTSDSNNDKPEAVSAEELRLQLLTEIMAHLASRCEAA
jgi:hypothetical protein